MCANVIQLKTLVWVHVGWTARRNFLFLQWQRILSLLSLSNKGIKPLKTEGAWSRVLFLWILENWFTAKQTVEKTFTDSELSLMFVFVCVIHLELALAVRETVQRRQLTLLLGSVKEVWWNRERGKNKIKSIKLSQSGPNFLSQSVPYISSYWRKCRHKH